MQAQLPAIRMAAATHACLTALTLLLIERGALNAQETLDAFSRLSGDVQFLGDQDSARIIEGLCADIASVSGATRRPT